MRLNYLYLCFILIFSSYLPAQIQIGQDIDGEAAGDQSGHSISMPDQFTIAIGAPQNDGNGSNAGHVRIYKWNGLQWIQKGGDIDGEAMQDHSGWVLSMADSNTVAIGAFRNDENGESSGHVRIYSWNGNVWTQKGLDIDGDTIYDILGFSVSMADSNTVALSAPGGGNYGYVRIYSWNGSSWLQKGQDIEGEDVFNDFGSVICMPDPNTIGISAPENDDAGPDAGHVRVFSWNGIQWIQKGQDIDGDSALYYFGSSMDMPDPNTVLIGSERVDINGTDVGLVRIFSWDGNQWIQKGQDIIGRYDYHSVGLSASMPDPNAFVTFDGSFNKGSIQAYQWNGSSWIDRGVRIQGDSAFDYLGLSVVMPNENTIGAGGFLNNGGFVKVYKISGIYGFVYLDTNQDCLKHLDDVGIPNTALIIQPGNYTIQSNSEGQWFIDSLPAGTYTITADTTNSNWQLTCPATQTFTVVHPDSLTHAADFGYVSTNPCPKPEVSIHAPFLRPGFSNQKVYVQACNEALGTDVMASAYVVVELDSLLTVTSSSLPYTALGNNQFEVYVGDLFPGQCVNFWLDCTLSTNAVLGQTLCMQADLYPVDSCALDSIPNPFPTGTVTPCTTVWDKSSLQVEAYCNNDSVCFYIYNTGDPGDGDMTCFAPVRVYLDGNYILLDSVQLNGGASTQFCFAGGGRTWRLEVDQHPLHPGNSNPNATVELCGNPANWTSNLVNILPMDDADPVRDIYCGEVTGSYDPNDKTGFPLGRGVAHEILANQPLEYLIRFQNTGTDTAFRVVIRDTLPEELNIFTVRSGVASHDYDFRMYGPRVLEWTFNNIMLPDSNVNEPASHGFVKFKVDQVPNLPIGTTINNRVGIYFDFNAPIITNLTEHTIGEPQILNVQTFEEGSIQPNWRAYPNPTTGQITLDLERTQQQIQLEFFDLQGRLLRSQSFSQQSQINWQLGEQPAGLYLLRVTSEQGQANLKIILR